MRLLELGTSSSLSTASNAASLDRLRATDSGVDAASGSRSNPATAFLLEMTHLATAPRDRQPVCVHKSHTARGGMGPPGANDAEKNSGRCQFFTWMWKQLENFPQRAQKKRGQLHEKGRRAPKKTTPSRKVSSELERGSSLPSRARAAPCMPACARAHGLGLLSLDLERQQHSATATPFLATLP